MMKDIEKVPEIKSIQEPVRDNLKTIYNFVSHEIVDNQLDQIQIMDKARDVTKVIILWKTDIIKIFSHKLVIQKGCIKSIVR